MSADPTAEHIDAACEVMHDAYERAAVGAGWETNPASRKPWADVPEANKASNALTSTDPAVHAALAASLPAEVMLAALVDRGTLTAEDAPIARYGGHEHTHWQQRWDGQHTHEGRRFVTPWEVAP